MENSILDPHWKLQKRRASCLRCSTASYEGLEHPQMLVPKGVPGTNALQTSRHNCAFKKLAHQPDSPKAETTLKGKCLWLLVSSLTRFSSSARCAGFTPSSQPAARTLIEPSPHLTRAPQNPHWSCRSAPLLTYRPLPREHQSSLVIVHMRSRSIPSRTPSSQSQWAQEPSVPGPETPVLLFSLLWPRGRPVAHRSSSSLLQDRSVLSSPQRTSLRLL